MLGSGDDTPICTYADEDKNSCVVTQDLLLKEFRIVTDAVGKDKLGFKFAEIVTHSNRSEAVMSMFLANTPIFLIMLIGRRSSDAFLKYIRRQVLKSVQGVSTKMIQHDMFWALPDISATIDDPRTRNSNYFATNLSDRALKSNRQRAMLPSFSLHY